MVLKRNIEPTPIPVVVERNPRKPSNADIEEKPRDRTTSNSSQQVLTPSKLLSESYSNKEVKKSDSTQINDLKKFLSKYCSKEKDTGAAAKITSLVQAVPIIQQINNNLKRNTSNEYVVSNLIQENRRVLKSGELSIKSAKTAIWNFNMQQLRNIVLFNDILMISVPIQNGEKYQIEDIVNLKTCKLRGNGQLFGGESIPKSHNNNNNDEFNLLFEIIWPGGSIEFKADSKELKEIWVLNIYIAICECVGENERGVGWRHHYMLGTMHVIIIIIFFVIFLCIVLIVCCSH